MGKLLSRGLSVRFGIVRKKHHENRKERIDIYGIVHQILGYVCLILIKFVIGPIPGPTLRPERPSRGASPGACTQAMCGRTFFECLERQRIMGKLYLLIN